VLAASSHARAGAEQTQWRLPVTIEVLKDVPAQTVEGPSQQKGVLYVSGKQPFVIKKGQRFLMVMIEADVASRLVAVCGLAQSPGGG
jgi:hypothetical protein